MARHPLNTSDIEVTLTKIARLILDDLKVSKKEMDIDIIVRLCLLFENNRKRFKGMCKTAWCW